MNHKAPFDSIESAHEFITLFAQVVLETEHDIGEDIKRGMSPDFPRRLDALQIVEYKLRTLESHLKNSGRVLNDLRSLRRLLLEERPDGGAVRQKPTRMPKVKALPSGPSSEARHSGMRIGQTVASNGIIWETVRKRAFSSWRDGQARNSGTPDVVPWYVRQDKKPVDRTTTAKAND